MHSTILENEHLSANTLFNFTTKFDYLKSKIENRFKPRLVLEDYTSIGYQLEWALPMVCFCDIRLSNILIHIKEYGNYGIGLKKEWGIEKGLNPLLYISSEHSSLLNTFSHLITDKSKKHAARFFMNFKPYSGKQNNKNRNFYNEREWRFIPNEDIDTYSLGKSDFEDVAERELINSKLFNEKGLDFTFSDIKYVILSDLSEIQDIVTVIANTFSITEIEVYKNIVFLTKKIIENDL